jgi:hypothetical protein
MRQAFLSFSFSFCFYYIMFSTGSQEESFDLVLNQGIEPRFIAHQATFLPLEELRLVTRVGFEPTIPSLKG